MKNTKGFTLIELLVVIAIIGILSVGAVAVFSGAQAKARDAARINDLSILRSALEAYATDHQGLYPNGDTTAAFEAALEGGYVQEVPNGTTDHPYFYATNTADGTSPTAYELMVALEASTNTGAAGATQTDGGNQTDYYEVGSDMTIATGAGGAATGAPAVADASEELLNLSGT